MTYLSPGKLDVLTVAAEASAELMEQDGEGWVRPLDPEFAPLYDQLVAAGLLERGYPPDLIRPTASGALLGRYYRRWTDAEREIEMLLAVPRLCGERRRQRRRAHLKVAS